MLSIDVVYFCRLLNFDDRAEANSSAEQYKDAEQNKFQRDNKDKQGMPGPNMSLAYRDDEIERQNFSNEATLRYSPGYCIIECTSMQNTLLCCVVYMAPVTRNLFVLMIPQASGCANMV